MNNIRKANDLVYSDPQVGYECDETGMTGLHWACKRNNEFLALLLVKGKSFIEAKDALDRTPLHFAVESQNKRLVLHLLIRGAQPWTAKGSPSLSKLCFDEYGTMTAIGEFRAAQALARWLGKKGRIQFWNNFIQLKKIQLSKL